MTRNTTWRRVRKCERCPICERGDWCLVTGPEGNPTAAICARIESDKRSGDAGWLHRLQDDESWQRPRRRTVRIAAPGVATTPDLASLAERCSQAIRPDVLDRLAEGLGLSIESLRRLRVGWSGEHRAYTFPMSDASGGVLGIRLRLPNGRKLSVCGGKEGLFIPSDLSNAGPLLICEGPTDTAAILDLGFNAVGRPSCSGGTRLLVDLVQRRQAAEVVIVADTDAHDAGNRGAENLAAVLVTYAASVRVIAPTGGCKDAREWKRCGATRGEVQSTIDAAPARLLTITTRKVGHHADAQR
ncbi:MAG: toprim domain-containing protein [Planctomycetota bacterium]|nr:toprim domain-containing protein [Planctomycetota bacterium]